MADGRDAGTIGVDAIGARERERERAASGSGSGSVGRGASAVVPGGKRSAARAGVRALEPFRHRVLVDPTVRERFAGDSWDRDASGLVGVVMGARGGSR